MSAAEKKDGKQMKKAILLVAFGTSVPKARKAFDNIARLTEKRFPDTDVRWCYTSQFIRKKLAKQGEKIDSPDEALVKLADAGVKEIALQSLHTIPGAEYDEVIKTVKLFRHTEAGKNCTVVLGKPMLSSHADSEKVMGILLKDVPKERKPEDAVVDMGHGSAHHHSDLIYYAAHAILNEKDKHAYMGTVEGHPTIEDIVKWCKRDGIKKAYLIPFMSVAGNHAMNDMASEEEDSWKSILEKEGVQCVPVMKGTAEIDGIVNVWLDHLEDAIKGKKH